MPDPQTIETKAASANWEMSEKATVNLAIRTTVDTGATNL
jgi:hypothetical protein